MNVKIVYRNSKLLYKVSRIYSINQLIEKSHDDLYEDMIPCHCQPVGETNLLECNCELEMEDYSYQRAIMGSGLNDTKGNEFFDGDIIRYIAKKFVYNSGWKETTFIRYVSYQAGAFFAFAHPNDFDCNSLFLSTHFEIIGNIYENPELKHEKDI